MVKVCGCGVQVVRLVDALAVRIAGSAECRKMDQQLEALARHIAHIEAQLAPNKVQGLQYQVDTVVAAAAAVVRPPLLPPLARDGVCSVLIELHASASSDRCRWLQCLVVCFGALQWPDLV